jgi:hypothetical protein
MKVPKLTHNVEVDPRIYEKSDFEYLVSALQACAQYKY